MKTLFLALLSLFILGCSSTSLLYSPKQIHLQNENFSHIFAGKTLEKRQKSLSQISVEQNIFKDEYNQRLVYEYARLSTGYKFKSSYVSILDHIFNAKKVKLKKDEKGLGFFIISLRNDEKVYVLVKTGTKKSLTMIYGLSEENFSALLNQKHLSIQELVKEENPIKSAWNEKLIITGVLLEKEGGRGSRKP